MLVLLILVLGALIVFYVGEYPNQVTAIDTPAEWDATRSQEEAFRLFSYAALNFMASPNPARPALGQPARRVDWTVLRLNSSMPPASDRSVVPAGWRLVYDARRWAICTPMAPATANAITDRDPLLSDKGLPIRYVVSLNPSGVATDGRAVLSEFPESALRYQRDGESELAAYVALCEANP
jgi:hypothetical protein